MLVLWSTCADPNKVGVDPTTTTSFSWWGERGSKNTNSGPLSAHSRNADSGPTFNAALELSDFLWDNDKYWYSFVISQGGVGIRTPVPHPSGSGHEAIICINHLAEEIRDGCLTLIVCLMTYDYLSVLVCGVWLCQFLVKLTSLDALFKICLSVCMCVFSFAMCGMAHRIIDKSVRLITMASVVVFSPVSYCNRFTTCCYAARLVLVHFDNHMLLWQN